MTRSERIIKDLQWYLDNNMLMQDEYASIEDAIHVFRAIVLTETLRKDDDEE